MSASLTVKIGVLRNAIKLLKNWHLYVAMYFRFLRDDVVLETRNGFRIKIRAKSTDLMAFTNVWLLHEYYKPGFEINDNDTIIDIGAHAGYFALYAAQFCRTGRILCFEPVKGNFDLLVENMHNNRLTNVTCHNIAVSNQNKPIRIYLDETDQAAHGVHRIGKTHIESDATTLSEIVDTNNIKQVHFLKLDCEGSEYDIFQATPDRYFEKIKKICLEYHALKSDHSLLEQLKNRLSSLNFQIVDNPTTDNLGMLYASK